MSTRWNAWETNRDEIKKSLRGQPLFQLAEEAFSTDESVAANLRFSKSKTEIVSITKTSEELPSCGKAKKHSFGNIVLFLMSTLLIRQEKFCFCVNTELSPNLTPIKNNRTAIVERVNNRDENSSKKSSQRESRSTKIRSVKKSHQFHCRTTANISWKAIGGIWEILGQTHLRLWLSLCSFVRWARHHKWSRHIT